LIDGNYHLVKYGWIHTFSLVIWCEKCHREFKVNDIIYKHPKKIDGLIINYYFCLPCAKELELKGAIK
jgi:hypothetical protein